jgi:HD-GYP domain-containing protein (c-di-GMP phosphodiesterase class II)
LTAQDRPYKPAVPLERALDIMTHEVQTGQLDQELFRLFVAARAFEAAASGDA